MSSAPSHNDNVEAVFPLAPTQEGMLYHTLKSPESAVYVGQHVMELEVVDSGLLREAWRLVVAQHMALRTVFAWKARSRPVQVVYRAHEPDWREVDLQVGKADTAAWLKQDASSGFALDRQPPSRMTWLKLSNERSMLVWTRHHLVIDGWSAQLVIAELHRAYTALRRGQPWQARRDPGMAAYVAWLQKQDSAASTSYWQSALADVPLNPGLESVRSIARGGRSARRISVRLTAEQHLSLTKCAAANQLTLSTLIHGAWASVLASLNDQPRVIFGSTVSGRPAGLPGHERIVGNLINTVPVVADTSSEAPLVSWLRQLQAAIFTSAHHGHMPFREILAAAGIQPGTTLFDSIVVFMNYPRAGERDTALRMVHASYDEHSHYPLAVLALPGDELELILIHDDELIAAHRADELLVLIEERLTSMPDAMTGSAARYFASERFRESSLVQLPLRVEPRTVVDCFWQSLARYPSRPALRHGDTQLSYAGLHVRITQIAARMDALGVKPGDRVVIQMPRSADAIAAIWAVLLLGGTYVPVSNETPIARLRAIAERIGARLVVSNRPLEVDTVLIPERVADDPMAFELDPQVALGAAYVIFTSGSTGEPKAITVTHDHLAYSLASRLQYYGDEPITFGLFSPLAFDSSVAGLFWSVACGGNLVVIDEELVMRPHDSMDYLIRHGVDTYLTLPGVHRALLEVAKPALAERLRTVIVAGEACPADILAEHRNALPRVTLVNEYGPTEATVWCAAQRFDAADMDPGEPYLTIGHAIPGVELAIWDDSGRPVSPGVTGELVVSGPTVAAPNRKEGRYATGDLVSANAKGELFFRGRKDQQLKIRGHRVDPLEIEAALSMVPGITESAVTMVRPEGAPDTAGLLTAFFVGEAHLNDKSLAIALAAHLPDYMIPRRFVRLDTLPRNANGKLARDRLMLPDRTTSLPVHAETPSNRSLHPRQAGTMIGNVWRELLPGVAIDLESNFFQVGGDSLLAMRMLARVERIFGMAIDLTVFMERPVLGDFAEAVLLGLPDSNPSELITLRVGNGGDRTRCVFCVHGDAYNLVPLLNPALTLHWISQWPTRISLTKNPRVLPPESIETIAARYQRYVEQTGATAPVLLGSCSALPVALELGQRLTAAGNPPRALMLMDLPGQALKAPLLRRLQHRATQSLVKSGVGWVRRRFQMLGNERARRDLLAKVQAATPLNDVEARAYTQQLLADAAMDYEPRPYSGTVVFVFSQRWRLGVSDENAARLPDPWAATFSEATIKFSPATHHDLLVGESAAFVAGLVEAAWD
jgi:amino acid adenylation domain-containing protein